MMLNVKNKSKLNFKKWKKLKELKKEQNAVLINLE